MLKTILAAADGSDHADKAVAWAIELAASHGAELVLLYVVPHREAPPELRHLAEVEHLVDAKKRSRVRATADALPPSNTVSALEESEVSSARIYREIGERLLDAGKRRAEGQGLTRVKTLVQDGDPAQRILEAAKGHGADLIVMGRRGLGDLKGLLLGSVSHKVSQLSDCACLTVR